MKDIGLCHNLNQKPTRTPTTTVVASQHCTASHAALGEQEAANVFVWWCRLTCLCCLFVLHQILQTVVHRSILIHTKEAASQQCNIHILRHIRRRRGRTRASIVRDAHMYCPSLPDPPPFVAHGILRCWYPARLNARGSSGRDKKASFVAKKNDFRVPAKSRFFLGMVHVTHHSSIPAFL